MHMYIYIYMYLCMHACMLHACMYVRMHVCMLYADIFVSMYVCMYVCLFVCLFVCLYVCESTTFQNAQQTTLKYRSATMRKYDVPECTTNYPKVAAMLAHLTEAQSEPSKFRGAILSARQSP